MSVLAYKLLGGRSGIRPVVAGGWRRQTEPLISPTVGWEGTAVQEPDVHYDAGSATWTMWYRGAFNGSVNGAIGVVTCTSDPTSPGNWTKYAGNPVVGQGGSGIAGAAQQPAVIKVGATYYLTYADGSGNLMQTTSSDGLAWNSSPTMLLAVGSVAGTHRWANSRVWTDDGGTTWWMFLVGGTSLAGGPPWNTYLFKASAITGTWNPQNSSNPLTTMAFPGWAGGYGSSSWATVDGVDTREIPAGRLVQWYAINQAASSGIPSAVTHAYSTAGGGYTSWTQPGVEDLFPNYGTYEGDQASDPRVLQVGGSSFLFFDGTTNTLSTAYINLATYPGSLAQLLQSIG